jgi:hypothetical protein
MIGDLTERLGREEEGAELIEERYRERRDVRDLNRRPAM